jgi:predicted nucleotidyltransferase|tara:strand:- start:2181 stop:3140 length:960 start_codon:yes stop_codon:yes gene_type:complete
MIRTRDFVETQEGLIFAVVSPSLSKERVHAYLRYFPSVNGERSKDKKRYTKVTSTQQSIKYLKKYYPFYVDNNKQYIPNNKIKIIYRPESRLKEILDKPADNFENNIKQISELFCDIPTKKKGITGSVLINLHNSNSDIDFVIYGIKNHSVSRKILKKLIDSTKIDALTDKQWRLIYNKRYPFEKTLTFNEFLWHEKRKNHRASYKGTILDILLVQDSQKINLQENKAVCSKGIITLKANVLESSMAFDSPAIYKVKFENGSIGKIQSYTHTYAGQAFKGEKVEARGIYNIMSDQEPLLIIGTTREAEGEYMKVLHGKE